MLSVIILGVVMLNVIMVSVVAPHESVSWTNGSAYCAKPSVTDKKVLLN